VKRDAARTGSSNVKHRRKPLQFDDAEGLERAVLNVKHRRKPLQFD
jgi:hypothetical protein